jgi:PAS domain S-box-containing protein
MRENPPYTLCGVDAGAMAADEEARLLDSLWRVDADLPVIICGARPANGAETRAQARETPGILAMLPEPFDEVGARVLARQLMQHRHLAQCARAQSEEVRRKNAQLAETAAKLLAETRRREFSELNMRGTQHRFELAFKAAAIPMAIMHTGSQSFLEVNDSFTRLINRTRDEILGQTAVDLGLVVREGDYEQLVQTALRAGRVRDFASQIQPRTGEPRHILLSMEPVVLAEEACVLVAILDVTEQRKLESQLRHSQKMDAIGQLAAGVAHDFNNLLTIIHGHASLQMARGTRDQQLHHSLTQVKLAADRAATLTRQLLAFSRKQVMQPKALSLNESIERSHAMLRRLLGETITLECACSPDLPVVWADESSLDQVLINLAVNARDAMPSGGVLHISTAVLMVDPAAATRHPDARPGRVVRLTVAYNGCGMDTTILNRLFEPFFTTKAPGKGTGLGLSTVYGIVKQHEGWVEVESTPGLGSRFHIFLEVTDKGRSKSAHETTMFTFEDGAVRQQKETVLVVEDEDVLREFVTAILRQQGYHVLEASDGLEALQICEQTVARIDLLLTDMVMPNGVSGAKLATRMLARRKGLKVLYTSGYSQELMENSGHLVIGTNFLPKPFDVNKLMKAVHRCLESPAPNQTETAALVK